ncbi:hypothetical protein [Streptomyces sp. NRRL B-24720]|uniref:hypothetical protein n=1 Tax=Streptomyces sp. NRRL B-24720 TaxID=1476876 RepID=UPI0004CA60C8|nr:hypothetical protein [Streptomyces sp. NRRL B-24720]
MTTRAPKTRTAPADTTEGGTLALSTTDTTPVEEVREPLFSVDGQDFTVPKVISPRVVFLALNSLRKDGPVYGAMYLMELLLGSTQYAQLIELYEQERITQEQFDQVSGLVSNLFFKHFNDSPDAAGKDSATS